MSVQHLAPIHRYRATCRWEGNTGAGYQQYDRTHAGAAPPAEAVLTLSSDPAFRGSAALLNPEQLLVVAAASCQLLSFLAVAARARIDVRQYSDEAEAEMPEDAKPVHIARIRLRPQIQVVVGPTEDRVRHLVQVAHHECYIANSLKTEVMVEPSITFVPG
jgi:organic hydroperoxide reductase OsmC/OhrA